jgi:hypothetical protein
MPDYVKGEHVLKRKGWMKQKRGKIMFYHY